MFQAFSGGNFPRVAPQRMMNTPHEYFSLIITILLCVFHFLALSQSQFITKINLSPIHYSPAIRFRESSS